MAAIVVFAATGFVVMELWGGASGAPPTLQVTASADKTLGPDRFYYSAKLAIAVEPRDVGRACLLVLGRNGQVLGKPLAVEGGRVEAMASALSASHFGPVWLVVLAGPGDCREAGALVGGARGADKPIEAIAASIEGVEGWRWGAARVHIHDKLP